MFLCTDVASNVSLSDLETLHATSVQKKEKGNNSEKRMQTTILYLLR